MFTIINTHTHTLATYLITMPGLVQPMRTLKDTW